MDDFLPSLVFSIVTGVVSSVLVVVYYEARDHKNNKLSQAHILNRFNGVLFRILTTIRATAGLPHPEAVNETQALEQLEVILGRTDPSILLGTIGHLNIDQHRSMYEQLVQLQQSLGLLFSDSVAHKTVEGVVSASIAETQEWVEAVLINYYTFPEVFENKADQLITMRWTTSVFNLTENTFATLTNMLSIKKVPDGMLRWGSRSKN